MTRLQRAALVLILLTAAVLRLTGLGWDDFQHHHPDERYIAWVATTIEFPSFATTDLAAMWRPQTSTFNPFHWPPGASSEGIVVLQDQPRDFAYGHLPLYLGVAATRIAERLAPVLLPHLPADWSLATDVLNGASRVEFDHLTAVGRALTALFDVGTVWLTFLLGRRLYHPTVGLLAASFLAVAVLHIQLAHFFASDPYMTFFVVTAIYFMVAAQAKMPEVGTPLGIRRKVYLALAAAMVGLAIGSKFAAILLILPLLWTSWKVGGSWSRTRAILAAITVTILAFVIFNPFAVIDWTCQPLDTDGPLAGVTAGLSRSCYLHNTMTQNAMVRGSSDLGFTRQYAGTIPYLYHLEMLLRWGLGPALGLVAVGGFGWAVWTYGRRIIARPLSKARVLQRMHEETITPLLLWVVPYFLLNGLFFVKYLRYMQPILPFLLLFGSAALWQIRSKYARRTLMILSLAAGGLYAIAFVSLYASEHPWNAASRWIHQNVAPGAMILSEQWDDYLPVSMNVDGTRRARNDYNNAELTWLTFPDAADNEMRLQANLELMAEAEYLTVLSNRVYGVIPRQPDRFPLSGQFHQLLFDGLLGYELVWVGERTPQLFGLSLRPDTFGWPDIKPPAGVVDFFAQTPAISFGRVDESFTVYDQPLTMIFRNTGNYSAEEMQAQFDMLASDSD